MTRLLVVSLALLLCGARCGGPPSALDANKAASGAAGSDLGPPIGSVPSGDLDYIAEQYRQGYRW